MLAHSVEVDIEVEAEVKVVGVEVRLRVVVAAAAGGVVVVVPPIGPVFDANMYQYESALDFGQGVVTYTPRACCNQPSSLSP